MMNYIHYKNHYSFSNVIKWKESKYRFSNIMMQLKMLVLPLLSGGTVRTWISI